MTAVEHHAIIIGAGPAGLIAAEKLISDGIAVDIYDAMPSAARKFLQAGKGGMNITHSDPFDLFVSRYRHREAFMQSMLTHFNADDLRTWCQSLGFETFVGSSGRVFPTDMRAAPLLRTWLQRLKEKGVRFHMRHRWIGWQDDQLIFQHQDETIHIKADVTLLALGGGSWPHLGSDGRWIPLLSSKQVEIAPLQAANCGFECDWPESFRSEFAGTPLKTVVATLTNQQNHTYQRQGEFVITERGVEGSLIYVFAADLRDQIYDTGKPATLWLDLMPQKTEAEILKILQQRGSKSVSSILKSKLHLDGVKGALLRIGLTKEQFMDMALLAKTIKQYPLICHRTTPMEEAISTAGGICIDALTPELMLKNIPGVFCAGEMLDWEAPTGGYLLTGCYATGVVAAEGMKSWLNTQNQ